jgi:hypothetical protein
MISYIRQAYKKNTAHAYGRSQINACSDVVRLHFDQAVVPCGLSPYEYVVDIRESTAKQHNRR